MTLSVILLSIERAREQNEICGFMQEFIQGKIQRFFDISFQEFLSGFFRNTCWDSSRNSTRDSSSLELSPEFLQEFLKKVSMDAFSYSPRYCSSNSRNFPGDSSRIPLKISLWTQRGFLLGYLQEFLLVSLYKNISWYCFRQECLL